MIQRTKYRYGRFSHLSHDRGHIDEAIDYLNVGIARLGADKSFGIYFLFERKNFGWGKTFFGGNLYLTNRIRKAAHLTRISSFEVQRNR